MCTAISYVSGSHYFGRNLDLDRAYGEAVVITPRSKVLPLRHLPGLEKHYAIIGMATVAGDYPLYYDAFNEKGLCMAGLNFPVSAHYFKPQPGKRNVATFEFIPWVLGTCATVTEARALLENANITDDCYASGMPEATLHWIISDGSRSLTVESTADGLHLYDNEAGVLSNEPGFPEHMEQLARLPKVSPHVVTRQDPCVGLGAVGLPGDWSSQSRFQRAWFVREYGRPGGNPVAHFFHLLEAVAMPRGAVLGKQDQPEYTLYSCCCDTARLRYYYTTYEDIGAHGVDMTERDMAGSELVVRPLGKLMED